jgi:hypothetical protein
MKSIRAILWFGLCFGIGNLIGSCFRKARPEQLFDQNTDYAGVLPSAMAVAVIAGLIFLFEIIAEARKRHDTSK